MDHKHNAMVVHMHWFGIGKSKVIVGENKFVHVHAVLKGLFMIFNLLIRTVSEVPVNLYDYNIASKKE